MLDTPVITETDFGLPATLAFRIAGRVTQNDMTALSERVLAAYANHDEIDLVLIFDDFEGSDAGASLSGATIKAQTAALWKVRTYVLVGASERAGDLVETMGKVLPVEATAFATEAEARAHLESLPRLS